MKDKHIDIFMGIVNVYQKELSNIEDRSEYKKYLKMYQWKIVHSNQVAKLCIELATREVFDEVMPAMEIYTTKNMYNGKYQLNEKGIYIAYLCGLYHDIGRFYQIARYHTEDDSKSPIDHGNLGFEIIGTDKGFNDSDLTEQDKEIIKKTILYHNRYELRDDITNDVNYFCCLLRDADKIDILKGLIDGNIPLNSKSKDPVSTEVINNFDNKVMVVNKNIKNSNDRIARFFSFYYDIKTLAAKNYLEKEKIFLKLYHKLKNKKVFDYLLNTEIVKRGKGNVR